MNQLIKVDYQNDNPTVSARELHRFLEVKTAYKDWFPRMCEYGFIEGSDFCSFLSESTGGRPAQDAALTIDMAKELCMIQRNERGKQARQYFIQLEKDWNSPEKVMARALRIAEEKISQLSTQNHQLLAENEQQRQLLAEVEPIRQYVDTILASDETLAITQIAADYEITARALNQILHEAGIQHRVNGQWILYQKHMGMGYTKSKTINITHADGRAGTKLHTQWTQKGRLLIHEILKQRGILAVMDRGYVA